MTLTDNARAADWQPSADYAGGARGAGSRSPQRIAEYERLRTDIPVAWAEEFGGYWTLSRYEDVSRAAKQAAQYESGQFFTLALPQGGDHIPITLNPPEHLFYRRLLNKYFLPARIDLLEARVRQYTREQVKSILADGSADVVPTLCQVVPARALAALMNLPDGASQELISQMRQFEDMGWDPAKVAPIIFGVFSGYIAKVVAERRQSPLDPEQDLISGAMAAEIDGQPLPDETVIGIGVQMIAAGHATSADAIAASIYRVATNPDIQARLRLHPELIPTAVEEFLRLESPLPELGRRATSDVEVHGVTIAEGEYVGLNFAAANRDPEEFEHPDSCIIDRSPNQHLTFGAGSHKCVGAPLARMELRVVLEELLAATSEIRMDGATEETNGGALAGIIKLPIRVIPAKAAV